MATARLGEIAYARSGDKGSGANIGLAAFTDAGYAWLEAHLTPGSVEAYFKPMGCGTVTRHALPGMRAFNFLLPEVLAGGGSRSLRIDAQGKALGQVLLEMPIDIPPDVLLAARDPKCNALGAGS